MNTLKTAVVVTLLLVVLYGVYTTLNTPPKAPPPEVAQAKQQDFQPPQIELSPAPAPSSSIPAGVSPPSMLPAPPASLFPDAPLNTAPSPTKTIAPTPVAMSPIPPETSPRVTAPPLTSPETSPVDAASIPPQVGAVSPIPDAAPSPSPPAYTNTGAPPIESSVGLLAFQTASQEAQRQLNDNKLADALKTLSAWYRSPDLKPEQQQQLTALLDQLAGTVVYSAEHHLEAAYSVKRGETLEQIAEQYQVPLTLLANINGLAAPYPLVPGQQLKVVRGPFRAEIHLGSPAQLTLFLGQHYAGRFDVVPGQSPPPKEGNFSILQKMIDRPYYGPDNRMISPGDPAHPYGTHWLGMEDQICIHGSGTGGDQTAHSCLSLNPRDAADVYGILSVGSRVTIRR